ncbi:hypothetical protein Bpfe_010365 [Biomphalaria pfeifferi]|uniref:Uncharacterized protein n=1 Tax=Biomphalaria pfeifferi TaxID=112525 RepID=A0AAD8BT53_BIOPF|nr:hypothetical protein Bpfe_010365 [Biomphalaria pfeifferi]
MQDLSVDVIIFHLRMQDLSVDVIIFHLLMQDLSVDVIIFRLPIRQTDKHVDAMKSRKQKLDKCRKQNVLSLNFFQYLSHLKDGLLSSRDTTY